MLKLTQFSACVLRCCAVDSLHIYVAGEFISAKISFAAFSFRFQKCETQQNDRAKSSGKFAPHGDNYRVRQLIEIAKRHDHV